MRNLPPNQGDAQRHTSGCTGLIRLSLCVVAMAILWGIVLPRVAKLPRVRDYSIWLDERGIDPSAMYYTELPAMDPILQRLERP